MEKERKEQHQVTITTNCNVRKRQRFIHIAPKAKHERMPSRRLQTNPHRNTTKSDSKLLLWIILILVTIWWDLFTLYLLLQLVGQASPVSAKRRKVQFWSVHNTWFFVDLTASRFLTSASVTRIPFMISLVFWKYTPSIVFRRSNSRSSSIGPITSQWDSLESPIDLRAAFCERGGEEVTTFAQRNHLVNEQKRNFSGLFSDRTRQINVS